MTHSSSFTAEVSHELRTPLTVIANELEVALRRSRSASEWEGSARTSLDEIWRLGRLVDALLRLARSDVAAPSVLMTIDAEALVEDAVAGHARAASAADVVIELQPRRVHVVPLMVRGERDALASALGNLLANAVRYTPAGGRIAVALEDRDPWAAIVVDDSGPGISPDEVEQHLRAVRPRRGRPRP